MDNIKNTIVFKLLKEWEKYNINYCHWKSIDHVKEGYLGITDLDILISPQDSKKAESIAQKFGFVKFYTHPLRTYPGVSDLILYDENLDRFIHLHLHYQLVLADRWVKAFRLPFEEKILKRKVYFEKLETWIINPIDEFIMFVCRMPLKFKKPFSNPKVINEILEIKNRIKDIKNFDEVNNLYPKSFISLAKEIFNGNYKVKHLEKKVVKDMNFYYLRMSIIEFKILTIIRYIFRIIVEINRRKLNNYSFGRRKFFYKGITVAFIGMDGAGKTSAIERNLKFFAKQMNVVSVFLGSGQSGAPWYRKIIFKIFGTKSNTKNNSVNKKRKSYSWYYLLYYILVMKNKLKRLNLIFKYNSSCNLVFVDRWPQRIIEGTFDGPRFQNLESDTFLKRYVQKLESIVFKKSELYTPDLILRFNVSPKNSILRKPNDLTLEEAQKAAIDIKKITINNSPIIDINADKTIPEVDREIRIAIWKIIQKNN